MENLLMGELYLEDKLMQKTQCRCKNLELNKFTPWELNEQSSWISGVGLGIYATNRLSQMNGLLTRVTHFIIFFWNLFQMNYHIFFESIDKSLLEILLLCAMVIN